MVDGNALDMARIGTRFSHGVKDGTEGYDGQFVYFIARNPNPDVVVDHLDVPSYRYQRILLPLLGRVFSFGDENLIPWTLLLLGITMQSTGTLVVSKLLAGWGVNRWYAITYGLWPGLVAAVRVMLPEPLAFALVAGAIYSNKRGKSHLSLLLYALAIFTKEVTVLFVFGHLIVEIVGRNWKRVVGLLVYTILPFALFQIWLLNTFGQLGIGSGGANATSFELIPFMGLFRILPLSATLFSVYLLLYLPFLFVPFGWGLLKGLKKAFISKGFDLVNWILIVNVAVIPFLPFSTYREPGGMLRFMSGMALALLLFAGKYKYYRALNYSPFWLALNFILFR
ncbi:MAG: hypothetical protein OEV06_02375 [Anaerolineae bacterium]|nr:hypothetical protein [Anaerolineae bacterium]